MNSYLNETDSRQIRQITSFLSRYSRYLERRMFITVIHMIKIGVLLPVHPVSRLRKIKYDQLLCCHNS